MGCNKIEEIYKPSIENYISKTKQLIEKKNFKGYASLIDFSTTKKYLRKEVKFIQLT